MNVGLMDANGDCFAIGMYITIHALALSATVKHHVDPGRRRADPAGRRVQSNDPYVGACHQMDVAVVAPIFVGDELVGWTGSTVHQIDLGGPVEGQYSSVRPRSGGAATVPADPDRRGRTLRRDVGDRPRRSRLPHLVGLDLKAIAGCNVAVDQVRAVERYTLPTVRAAIRGSTPRPRLASARLAELPDGTWSHRGYIEHDRVPRRRDDDQAPRLPGVRLLETDDQARQWSTAPAGVRRRDDRCSLALPVLRHPVVAGGLQRVEVPREGSVVHAAWPAGSLGHDDRSFMTTISALGCSVEDARRQRSTRPVHGHVDGGLYVEDVFGVDQRGEFFGAAFLDAMAGGSGARANADGLDAGGFLDSPSSIIANIEDYEYAYPVLYLYRRIQPDTGGAGKFRGGATVSMMYVPHDVDEIPTKIMHAIGTEQPGSTGIFGGSLIHQSVRDQAWHQRPRCSPR